MLLRILVGLYHKYGRLSREIVTAEAAEREHPLHIHFEWDDKIAGHQYRLIQAERLIESASEEERPV